MDKHYRVFYEILKERPHMIGCEVGVHTGLMPKHLLNALPTIQRYYAVDPWESYKMYSGKIYRKPGNPKVKTWRQSILKFYDNTYKHKHKVIMMRMTSIDSVKHFEDESLDWVFIDANHEYRYIKENLNIWVPKVKSGGVVAGHDYGNKWVGIKRAVDEFVPKDKLHIEDHCVWWYIK